MFGQVEFNHDNISKLPFIEGACLFYHENKNNNKDVALLYIVTSDSYNKIKDLYNEGITDYKISKGDRVYVNRGTSIPVSKIKNTLSSLGATYTKDIDKANVYVTGTQAFQSIYRDTDVSSSNLGLHLCMNSFTGEFKDEYDTETSIYSEEFLSKVTSKPLFNLFTYKGYLEHNSSYVLKSQEHLNHSPYTITPQLARDLYEILSRKTTDNPIHVISDESLSEQIIPTMVLDKDVYSSLNAMFESRDSEDGKLAVMMLVDMGFTNEESLVYLYKLMTNHSRKVQRHTRFKSVRKFLNNPYVRYAFEFTPDQYMSLLLRENLLTEEGIDLLMPKDPKPNFRYAYVNDIPKELFTIEIKLSEKAASLVDDPEKYLLSYTLNDEDND